MKVRCKSSFIIGSKHGTQFRFNKNDWYTLKIQIHEETGVKIHFLIGEDGNEMPMLKRTFDENFDTIQYIREEKLKKLFNE